MQVSRFLVLVLVVIVIDSSCKKEKTYNVSEITKEYFSFTKGSYWIYSNDSTEVVDSTYQKYYSEFFDNSYNNVNREIILVGFTSSFLSRFTLGYACTGPDEVTVASRDNDTSKYVSEGVPMYNPSLFSNTALTHTTCLEVEAIELTHLQNIIINNVQYNDIIRSKVYSLDSSSTYPFFLVREMYFAKHVGILKFFEIDKVRNLKRSWSLLRYKVVQ